MLFLDNDAADLSGFSDWARPRTGQLQRVRFLGCTLWTDYRFHPLRPRSEAMARAENLMTDHRRIWTARGRFRARHALEDHLRSRDWLKRELAKPFPGQTVVITHHGPHPKSVHPRFLNPHDMVANAAFVSDLSDLMQGVDLWLHGHTHDSFDYTVGRCRVIANPRGYPRNLSTAATVADLAFENPCFQRTCAARLDALRGDLVP